MMNEGVIANAMSVLIFWFGVKPVKCLGNTSAGVKGLALCK